MLAASPIRVVVLTDHAEAGVGGTEVAHVDACSMSVVIWPAVWTPAGP